MDWSNVNLEYKVKYIAHNMKFNAIVDYKVNLVLHRNAFHLGLGQCGDKVAKNSRGKLFNLHTYLLLNHRRCQFLKLFINLNY